MCNDRNTLRNMILYYCLTRNWNNVELFVRNTERHKNYENVNYDFINNC